jgi:hypothetical protein
MTLKELVNKYTWSEIEPAFRALYPTYEKDLRTYERVFQKLLALKENNNAMTLEINKIHSGEDDLNGWLAVSGKEAGILPNGQKKSESYSLIFQPWSDWLGMHLSRKTLHTFSDQQIISSCLFEMTFMGFSEGIIKREIEKLHKATDKIDNMTAEEKKRRSITLEELLKP